MSTYTVNQLATLSGVTPRTLRFYDKVGLLSPATVGKNGYRYYGEVELLRLQQILFFRELEFPLEEIKRMLNHPDFKQTEALRYQRQLIEAKRTRLGNILKTIDRTMNSLSNNEPVTDAELYGSLSQEEIESRKQEAKERWGNTDAYRISQERVKKMTKADMAKMQEEGTRNMTALVALLNAGRPVDDPEVQNEVTAHHAGIERFYPCSPQMYRGLGDMYLQDQRFADHYRQFHKDLPEFLVEAMRTWCAARGV